MKKNVMKTLVAAVCVVAAGMGGLNAYSSSNQAKANMLLAESVEALSDPDGNDGNDAGKKNKYLVIHLCCTDGVIKDGRICIVENGEKTAGCSTPQGADLKYANSPDPHSHDCKECPWSKYIIF